MVRSSFLKLTGAGWPEKRVEELIYFKQPLIHLLLLFFHLHLDFIRFLILSFTFQDFLHLPSLQHFTSTTSHLQYSYCPPLPPSWPQKPSLPPHLLSICYLILSSTNYFSFSTFFPPTSSSYHFNHSRYHFPFLCKNSAFNKENSQFTFI